MRVPSAQSHDLARLTIAWVFVSSTRPAVTLRYQPDLDRLSHRAIASPEWCGARTHGRNGYVYSHEMARKLASEGVGRRWEAKENHYPIDANCSMSIYAGLESRLLLQFPRRIDLECSTDGTMCDCLRIHDGTTANDPLLLSVCGYRERTDLPPVESTTSTVVLQFVTDGDCKNGEGFIVQFSAFRTISHHPTSREPLRCHRRDEFRCDNNRCIPVSFLCDNITQCIDGTDETTAGCSHDAGLAGLLMKNTELMAMLCVLTILIFLLFAVSVGFCVKENHRRMNRVHAQPRRAGGAQRGSPRYAQRAT